MDEAIGFKHAVVWDKGGLGMGWHYRRNYEMILVAQKSGAACRWYGGNDIPNVLRISGIKPGKDDHPTPKPVAVPSWFLKLHTRCGDVVLDPFNGGGSTALACKRLGRRYIGVELDERWLELTASRLESEPEPLLVEDHGVGLRQDGLL